MNIYISLNALENALFDEGSGLHQILNKLPGSCTVYADITEDKLEERMRDPDQDILSELYLGSDTGVKSGSSVIASINQNNRHVLDDPTAIYILDIAEDVAKTIQDQYGVICKSSNNPDLNVLLSEHRTADCVEDDPGSWNSSMYSIVETAPLNSIIVSDRYLFSDDELDKEGQFHTGDGFENLISILDCILPRNKKEEPITVLIYCEAFKFDGNPYCNKRPTDEQYKEMESKHFRYLSNRLNKEIKGLRKGLYFIEVEVISFGNGALYHEKTHNRRILTNYSELYAEHKLAAFKNNKCLADQNITSNTLFSEGIKDKSDCPIISHHAKLKRFIDIFKYGKKNKNMYLYSYCGNTTSSEISAVKNYLIKPRLV